MTARSPICTCRRRSKAPAPFRTKSPGLCRGFLLAVGTPSAAHREGLGRCAGGRRLDKCPPSSACGGRLLLYFVQTPATRAAARLADSRELPPGPPGCLKRGGSGGWLRSKGGGAGRRPVPGDIRTQPPLPPALDPAALAPARREKQHKKARPRCSGGRARRGSAVEGAWDQNTKLTPATGPLNSCFRPMVPSLPFLSASSLNQS